MLFYSGTYVCVFLGSFSLTVLLPVFGILHIVLICFMCSLMVRGYRTILFRFENNVSYWIKLDHSEIIIYIFFSFPAVSQDMNQHVRICFSKHLCAFVMNTSASHWGVITCKKQKNKTTNAREADMLVITLRCHECDWRNSTKQVRKAI